MEVSGLDEYVLCLKELVTDPEIMVVILRDASKELHKEEGDLDELTRKIRRNGVVVQGSCQ